METKVANLVKAADYLKLAQEHDLANQVRAKAEKTRKTVLITAKLREIKKLQDEVAALQRQLAKGKQVILHLQVMEVSVDKLRKAGVDGDALIKLLLGGADSVDKAGDDDRKFNHQRQMAPLAGEHIQQLVETLREQNLVRVLAEPTLVTVSGRPASFQSGGEIPLLVPQSLGRVSVEYRSIGTRIDCVPQLLGDNRLRLELRPSITVVDDNRSVEINGTKVPGLRTRMIDTAMEIEMGQTTYIGGLVQVRSADHDPKKTEHTALLVAVRPEWPESLAAQEPTPVKHR